MFPNLNFECELVWCMLLLLLLLLWGFKLLA